MRTLLTVVMAVILTPFFANAEETSTSTSTSHTSEEVQKEEAQK